MFAEVNKSLPEHAVLKLAVDNENLGLCDSRDYFTDKLNFDIYSFEPWCNHCTIAKSDGAMIQFVLIT